MAANADALQAPQTPQPSQPASPAIRDRRAGIPWLSYLLISPPLFVVFTLIFLPALQSFFRTLVGSGESTEGGISLARYAEFFQSPQGVANLMFTLEITVITILALFVLCFPLSIYLRFSRSRIAQWVQSLALFPVFVPGIILSFSLIQFLGTRGTLETILNMIGISGYHTPYLKPDGVVIALIWENIPFTVLVLTAGLQQIDDAVIECARDVGANDWQVFTRIILPLLQRPALIAFSLNFIGIFGSYTVPFLLGPAAPQMMGVLMQRTLQEFREPRAAETQAVITFLICLVVGLLYVRTVSKRRGER